MIYNVWLIFHFMYEIEFHKEGIKCCPKKNKGALNQALRIATTEWGLTAQIIISSAYVNSSRTPLYMRITQERHVCEYMFLHKKWSSLHGLHPYHFVGEVLLHSVYWSFQPSLTTVKKWHLLHFHPVYLGN